MSAERDGMGDFGFEIKPLLTKEQEVLLFKRIEAGKVAKTQMAMLPENDSFVEKSSLQATIDDGNEARETVFSSNIGLVVHSARWYRRSSLTYRDLVQEGSIGLLKAIEGYDYTYEGKFSTYAIWWIRQTISRAVSKESPGGIKHSVHEKENIDRFLKANARLAQELGRFPSDEEVAERIGLSVENIQNLAVESLFPDSLNEVVFEEGGKEVERGDFFEDPNSVVAEQKVEEYFLKQAIEKTLETLSPREKMIISLRFGLETGQEMNCREISERFGISDERVRQLTEYAVHKLKHPNIKKKLEDFY